MDRSSSRGRRAVSRRDRGRTAVAVAAAAVAAVILAVVAVPRIPPVWSFVWGLGDLLSGGVEDRHKLLRDNPFPAKLAPSGYRLERNEEMCDPEECSGWAVYFAGPDDEASISYYPHAMTAGEVYEYWKRGNEVFGTKFLAVENIGSDSFCEEGDDVFHESHEVSCVAAFDGMAVIAESVNRKPGRGSLEHAVTLLRVGVAHWESIRD
jgi:hypothetical protein